MKKSIPILLCAFALASSLAAEQPQIAFRLLDDYVVKRQEAAERERKVGGIIGISLGAVFAGASAATWFSGDEIYQSFGGEGAMNSNLKVGLTLGFAATGGVCLWSGFDSLMRKPANLRSRYADVYGERDPDVQEAMAVATLKDLSVKAKNKRIGSIITDVTLVSLSLAASIGGEVYAGRPWFNDLGGSLTGQAYFLGDAICKFLFKSEAELLFDKYLTARQAFYSAPSEDQPRAPAGGAKKGAKAGRGAGPDADASGGDAADGSE